MAIETELFPNNMSLTVNKDSKDFHLKSLIVDEELDPIEIDFENDDCAKIDTTEYDYITLSLDNLKQIENLILEAKEHYNEHFKNDENK